MLGLLGCGRVGFDDRADAADDPAHDAPADACTFGPWGARQPLATLDTVATEFGPVISDDLLRIYFDSDRAGTTEIYVAERSSPAHPFGTPTIVPELDSNTFDGNATLTADELDLVFSSNRATPTCLYEATRTARTDPFSGVSHLDMTCSSVNAPGGGHLSRDGLRLYYNDMRDAKYEGAIFMTERASRAAPFGPPAAVAGLDAVNKGFPSLSADELTIYYEQDNGLGGLQVLEAHRSAIGAPFGPAARPPGFAPNAEEEDPAITGDGTTMVFSSVLAGNDDLYLVARACL
jgi:hypothetical protein